MSKYNGPGNAETPPAVRWNHNGIACVMVPQSGHHWCAYVQLPAALRNNAPADWNEINVHGGVTWPTNECGCDDDGWIGFDTAHAGDVWKEDVPGKRDPMLEIWGSLFGAFGMNDGGDGVWTLARLKEETEQLADQIATLTAAVAK